MILELIISIQHSWMFDTSCVTYGTLAAVVQEGYSLTTLKTFSSTYSNNEKLLKTLKWCEHLNWCEYLNTFSFCFMWISEMLSFHHFFSFRIYSCWLIELLGPLCSRRNINIYVSQTFFLKVYIQMENVVFPRLFLLFLYPKMMNNSGECICKASSPTSKTKHKNPVAS